MTEPILTNKQIIDIAGQTETADPGRDGYILPVSFAREIEQAVLQAPEMRARKRGADRWRKAGKGWRVFKVELHTGAVLSNDDGIPWSILADQVDAAGERQLISAQRRFKAQQPLRKQPGQKAYMTDLDVSETEVNRDLEARLDIWQRLARERSEEIIRLNDKVADLEAQLREPVSDTTTDDAPSSADPYLRDVTKLSHIDAYRLQELYDVPAGLEKVLKNILAAGQRGAKSREQDLREAIKALERRIEMDRENEI